MVPSSTAHLASAVETVIAERESIAENGPLAGLPITTITLRDDARGAAREIRIVGGTNAHGGRTWLADTPVPEIGAIVSSDPRDWKYDYVPGSPPSTWPSGKIPVPFTFQLADPRDLGASAFPELDVAERAWSHVSCTAFRASLAARANVTGADDGVNAVIWHDDAWPSELVVEKLGQVVISTDAMGNYEDVDIHMNGADYTWSLDGAGDTIDARGVYEHELGHALGLGHSSDVTATMYAADPGGESWRSLEADDADGVCALYPGTGAAGCDTGAACPSGYACVAENCEKLGEKAEVCSPCVREVGACAGAGEDARCIDIGTGANMGRVCGRKCASDSDCGGGFHCLATTTSGDLQCVSDDACASGPDPCASDADCHGNGTCKSNACVGAEPPDADAGAPSSDAGSAASETPPPSSGGGCNLSPRNPPNEGRWSLLVIASLLVRRRKKIASKNFAIALLAALVGLASSACDKKTDLSPQHPTTPSAPLPSDVDEHGQTSCKNVVARLDSLGMRVGKPPQQTYFFDVRLHNPSSEGRWLVLPQTFSYDGKDTPAPGKGAVSGLKADVLSGRGKVVWVTMGDPGGFRALFLPPHANVTLRNLPVDAWWQTQHKTAKLEVILAKSIAIDEKPLDSFVKGDLKSEDDADSALDADPRDTRIVDKSVAGMDSHSVTFEEDCRGYGQAILKLDEP